MQSIRFSFVIDQSTKWATQKLLLESMSKKRTIWLFCRCRNNFDDSTVSLWLFSERETNELWSKLKNSKCLDGVQYNICQRTVMVSNIWWRRRAIFHLKARILVDKRIETIGVRNKMSMNLSTGRIASVQISKIGEWIDFRLCCLLAQKEIVKIESLSLMAIYQCVFAIIWLIICFCYSKTYTTVCSLFV